jgi:hypothetical protein
MLEGMLQKVRPEVANDHFSHDGNIRSPTLTTQESQLSTVSLSTETVEEPDDLSSKVGLLALNAPGTEPHYFGSSSAFAFSRIVNSSLRRLRAQEREQPQARNDNSTEHMNLPCQIPSPATRFLLSKSYFEHVHTQYPFLHEATFRGWEHAFMSNLDESSIDPVACFFVNIVYAVGALVLPRSNGYSPEVTIFI